MLALLLAASIVPSACSLTIGVGRDGAFFTDRFNGWYNTSQKTLASVLRGGCYNDANPVPISAIRLEISPDAPKPRVALVLSILEQEGWKRENIKTETWSSYPEKPR